MKSLLQVSVVALAAALALLSWFVALAPFWLTQSGERSAADATAYYSQGIGLWLNFTEHVGAAAYDPGNSLWVPPQPSAAESFASQCAAERAFCADAVGELHRQYCQVMDVYCGGAVTFLQLAMSAISGFALLSVVWAVFLISTARKTAADRYLMHLCVAVGVLYLAVVAVWYVCVYRVVLETTFYKDQFNRCNENPTGRKCWQVGLCVYLAIAGGVLYPLLSLLVVHHVTNKFRHYQRLLRRLFESATMVDLPQPVVALKEQITDDQLGSVDVAIEMEQQLHSQTLQPLRKLPSAVRPGDVEIDDIVDDVDDRESSRTHQHDGSVAHPSSLATGSHHISV